ncbi:hypothetical protein [Microvirga solisilvae]|uniref:hypothetical protein n=1 Tax=Microvirga solisilvae TaxID=2919498 RepID=UPI001FAFEB57|nr:hypothetical protein [Microvirga solisilvae]
MEPLSKSGTAGNDIFRVTASDLFNATFNGRSGTDTLQLVGSGPFYVSMAKLTSIETIRGTGGSDTIILNGETLAKIKTINGGGGSGDVLRLESETPFDFRGKTISGITRIEVDNKQFNATFDNKALALKVWAQSSQNDHLTLVGGTFTEAERAQLHRQGVDNITDASGTYTNEKPRITDLNRDKVYTSGGQAYLDRGRDVTLNGIDDKLKSLNIYFEDEWMSPGAILIADDLLVTLPDGLIGGGRISFEGTVIGTIDELREDGINIIFNDAATTAAVEALMRSLIFKTLDPDPSSVRNISTTIILTDEGGRYNYVRTDILAGGADVRILTPELDALSGTDGDDIFAVDEFGSTSGDVVNGGGGVDTLLLSGGGVFDLSKIGTLESIEKIVGSNQADVIKISGDQVSGHILIDGGEVFDTGTVSDNSNFMEISGVNIDLSNVTVKNINAITLLDNGASVTVSDMAVARLINIILVTDARIRFLGTLTDAEKGELFRRGFVGVTDDAGTYTNHAPELEAIDGDVSTGIAGTAIFIDENQDARVFEDDYAFNSLTVSVEDGNTTEILSLANTGKVQILTVGGGSAKIYVNGINIGFVATPAEGGSTLQILFNQKSAPSLVREVIRALTYTDTTGTITTDREIKMVFTDYTGHTKEVRSTIRQELNESPTGIELDGNQIHEAAANGTLIGVLSGIDPNPEDSFTFKLLNDAGGRFALVGNTVVVKQGVKLDYEQAASHEIKVQVTDKRGQTFDKVFTIDVNNVLNEITSGTSGRDVLVGGSGNDRFHGKLGNDVLTGGAGRDIFVFDTKLSSTNVDTIRDFNVPSDTIWLSRSIFSKITKTGTLSSTAFWTGAKAHDASDRIIYDKATGYLSYDADGTGSIRAIKFAKLAAGLKMTAADFVMV